MILPFSTQFNDGTPTNFVGKIWSGLMKADKFDFVIEDDYLHECQLRGLINGVNSPMDELPDTIVPKYHTIRKDVHNRWAEGNKIHMVVFNRSKDQFQFAPVLVCKSVQEIEIIRTSDYLDNTVVKIDGRKLDQSEVQQLAWNDGFLNLVSFWLYFQYGFTGKLIHWTDLKY